MANELPVGGVTIDQVQPQYRQWFIDAAQKNNVPLSFLLNIYGAETSLGTNFRDSPAARGIMQIGDTTAQRYGINNRDAQSSISGAARLLGNYIQKYGDPYMAAIAYNAGEGDPTSANPMRGLLAYQTGGWGALRDETVRYVDNVMRGVGPSPSGLRDYMATHFYGMPGAENTVFSVPLSTRQFDPLDLEQRMSSLASPVQERLQQGYDFLDAWAVSDPGKASAIHGLEGGPAAYPHGDFPWTQGQVSQPYGEVLQYYGYMPSNLRYNAQTGNWDPTANPVSTEGPWGTAALSNWVQDTVSDPNVSAGQRWYVQQLGGLAEPPSNLEIQAWSPWGTSGDAGHGATNWSLGVGRSGAIGSDPEVSGGGVGSGGGVNLAPEGIDVGHWLSQWVNDFFREPTGTRGNLYDASSNFGTSGNVYDASGIRQGDSTVFQPGSNVYDASGVPPADNGVVNWVPAGGTWGTPGQVSPQVGWAEQQAGGGVGFQYNPITQNWGTFGGSGATGDAVNDYNQWYNDVMGAYTDNPGQFDIGPYGGGNSPNVMSVLADIQSGASNPLFAGSIWSGTQPVGVPSMSQQIAATTEFNRYFPIGGQTYTSTGNIVPITPLVNTTPSIDVNGPFGTLVNPTNPLGIWGLG